MNYKIKEMQEELKPRYRARKKGISNLSNEELLSLIIRCGTRDKNVKNLSVEVLQKVGDLSNFLNIDINDLMQIKGIGEVNALSIMASIEMGKRVLNYHKERIKLISSKVVYDYIKYEFLGLKQEKVLSIYLDNAKQLIEYKELFLGTVNGCLIHPREVFKYAVILSASSIILVHNHPSGNLNPSKEDIKVTEELIEVGSKLNIPLIDNIIVSDKGYLSIITKVK